jgi:hypothetical protein
MNNQNLSDQNLYQLCKTYGARALEWRRKFIGLLPEVNRRRLYEKKGFGSIFVFAYKLAGLSEDQVRLALNLERRFEGMPELRGLLVNGEVSVNKLTRVASIANAENEKFLAGQVRILSNAAVETLVRDGKWVDDMGAGENQNGLFEPENRLENLHVQTLKNQCGRLNLSLEVQQKLFELQQKGFDVSQMILGFLKKREEGIAKKKEEISKKVLQREEKKSQRVDEVQEFSLESVVTQSRYISQPVKGILKEEYGTKCSIRNCEQRATTIHHTQRFSLARSHDPHYLAPLCKEHHEIAHACDMRYQEVKSLSRR